MIRTLWELARPRLLPFVLALAAAGFGWAHWDRALFFTGGRDLLWVLAAWTALHAGTLWWNAALDQDSGEVLYGTAVPVPDGVGRWGLGALVLAVILALPAGATAFAAVAVCAVLAVLYSLPGTAWKGHPLGGPLVNLVGYGWLTPLAGWSVVGVDLNARTAAVCVGLASGVLGTYFAAQAFQADEDRSRGYRTLVATHGPRTVLVAARICVGIALADSMVLAAIGWLPRICLAGAPAFLWLDHWLAIWSRQPNGGTEADAREFTRRALRVGFVGVVLAFAQYTWESATGAPVAGLGTAAGQPGDRSAAEWRRERNTRYR